eukprot:6843189-Alexandrium_andersonii.AAC.1
MLFRTEGFWSVGRTLGALEPCRGHRGKLPCALKGSSRAQWQLRNALGVLGALGELPCFVEGSHALSRAPWGAPECFEEFR